MILLVFIFVVNRNFKLLNQDSILLFLTFVLLPFAFCIFYVIIVCFIAVLLLLLFTYYYYYLFTYLFIYSYLL